MVMAEINLDSLKKQAEEEIEKAENLAALNDAFNKYLGKKGELTLVLRSLKDLPEAERREVGKMANQTRQVIENMLTEQKQKLQAEGLTSKAEWFDVTAPGKKPVVGHLHPLTLVQRRAREIFEAMGFSVVEGPEVESEKYNFDALNIPKDHPAREMWDTFWLKPRNRNLLLRTHTSPVQIRHLEKNNPPLRIIAPGKVFRYEATDASHETNFYQLEGLMVGKEVSAANFKAIIQEFFSRFFNKEVKVRLRPSYFPFTEPSFEVDMTCLNCQGKGCASCAKSGWLEMMGAGMVHPAVFKNSGLNPKGLTGFAFGMGLDRLAMMKYKINDIRLFHSGDLRFIKQF